MDKKLVSIYASSTDSLVRTRCGECKKALIISSNDGFCPFCFTELEANKVPVTLSASVKQLEKKLKCTACESTIYSDGNESVEVMEASIFCPKCGSANVEAISDEDFSEDDVEETEDTEDLLGDENEDVEGKVAIEEVKASDEEVEVKASDEEVEVKASDEEVEVKDSDEDPVSEEEELQNEELDASAEKVNISELEASFINKPEPTWVFFNNGTPTLKISKSRVSKEASPIFSTNKFPEIFIDHAKVTTLATAIKDFNAEVLSSSEVLSSLDLENLAFEKLQAQVLPKLQDCIALAIEGAAKGVYADLNQDLKASFFDHFVTRGMPESKVQEAIEASFLDSGAISFTAILAKATELMYKKDESYAEIKHMIQASGPIRKVTEQDLESQEVRTKLKAGNLPLSSTEVLAASILNRKVTKTSVDDYRDRIKFKS